MLRWTIRTTWLATGMLAAVWAGFCLPILAKQAPLEAIAKRVTARESYQPGSLSDFGAAAIWSDRKWQHPSVLVSRAAIDLRLLERAMALSDTSKIDGLLTESETTIQRSLAVVPADPFLWTVYFWVENNRLGFKLAHLNYLRRSYETGPSEGWVAVSRGRFALALFTVLPPDMADMAVDEFSRLVASHFYGPAIDLLSRQSEPLASRLLASLGPVEFENRQNFATAAYRRGYDWQVPGVNRREWRPWH